MKEFEIKSELLKQAFWGGYLCKNGCLQNCAGYFNYDTYEYGRGFIEYCISRIFGIHRVPGFEQYYIKDATQMKMKREYGNLKEADINNACEELKEYYIFLQKELQESPFINNGKIKLVRSLRPFEIEFVTPQLIAQQEYINMPVNIINSYAHDGRLYGYGSSMSIVREVDIEKVVMYFETLHHPNEVCGYSIRGGEYEVWVMEDNMFGIVELPRECFQYKELKDTGLGGQRSWSSNKYEGSLFAENTIKTKPCELDKITRWLINKKRIMEIYGLTVDK